MTETKETIKKKIQIPDFKSIVGGGFLGTQKVTKQLPFIFWLVFLIIAFIYKGYLTEKTIRETEMVRDSLKEYKAESVIHETNLMYINRPSEVARRIVEREIELIEPIEPARKIKVKKIDNK